MLTFDHVAVAAETLEAGVEAVEAALGVPLEPGGRHAAMGTHNRLLGLGDLYLEVIAVDPGAPAPARPRWFDLDRFAGAPRPTNWVARCDDLEDELAEGPEGLGAPLAVRRGDLAWRMAVPADGRLPFDGLCPALIEWEGAAHPAARLPDRGCRLRRLTVIHPEAADLAGALAGRLADDRVVILPGLEASLRVEIQTPNGLRLLS